MAVVGGRATPWLFLAPTILLGTVFFAAPLLAALGLSLTRWDSLSPPRFVGLANYTYLVARDPLFFASLWNTVRFVGATLLFGVPLALILALAFRRSRLKALWRSAFWLPMVTNIVAVAYVWQFLLADPYGLVNRLLAFAGISGPPWLASPDWAMSAIVVIYVWFHLGQDMMLISAGLDAVDPAVEEAAEMDGAGTLARLRHVTLPLIRPTLLLVVATNLVKGAGYFALMLILTDGGPANSTNVAALHVYQLAFANLRLGMSSAAAVILTLMMLAVLLVQFRLMRRGGLEAW